ncbi:MAG: tRNA (adenosine(37)-N6)-dimethylallyltransferase MiaA [Mariniphaga sp.]|nr:tRNA (adenosine(37)-N6)-dimethylallyltransferase MiaA [Mariniphaga sp.]
MEKSKSKYNLVTILGPTASGKTAVAAELAAKIGGEVISADSRQVYRGMDLGTGKDYEDYIVNEIKVPYHLVDIVDAGYQYNVFEFQRDFLEVFKNIRKREVFPVLCGGSGLYIEAVLKNYKLIQVPLNKELRDNLTGKSLVELISILKKYKTNLHNISDTVNEKRILRAIEIEEYYQNNLQIDIQMPDINSLIIGVKFDRLSRRKRITTRLKQRFDEGMVLEVQKLLDSGITPKAIIYYGLEYKFITLHLVGDLSFDQMFEKLNIAIHQFAKRQMTWFRKMEKQGTKIHWLDGYMPMEQKIDRIISLL